MTTSTTAKKATQPKETPAPVVNEEKVSDTSVVAEETPKQRIPQALLDQSLLADFCTRYLDAFDKISAYNKEVLASKDAEWNPSKVLVKAQELGNPTDANVQPDTDIKAALTEWENAVNVMNVARRKVVTITASKMGITLSSTAERDPQKEEALKEMHKTAVVIGTQLSMLAGLTTDANAASAVQEFLTENELPAIGRDSTRNFGESGGKATPKYRVTVEVFKNEKSLLKAAGFTKTAAELSKPEFGYERGEQLKSDDLRKAWEAAGNSSEKTVTNPVEFEHNNLKYVITKN